MKKNFILKFVLVCISLCISLNARTQTATLPSSFTETSAPTGEVRFPAEFEPVQAVVIAHYTTGRNLPVRLIKEMAQEVKVITLVNTDKYFTTEQVRNLYASGGLTESELANCEFIEAPLNGRWTRDFTPWFIFNGTEPAIVENIYNRCYVYIDNNNNVSYITDPNNDKNAKLYDDAIPQYFKEYFKDENGSTISLPMYGMKVVHTGGNMMQDGRGVGVSDLIVHTESEMFLGQTYSETDQKMKDYLGIDPYHVTIDPQGKYIAHVDCWGKFLAPDKILIAQVSESNAQYSAYEEVANYFANTNCCWGYPYTVYRVFVPEQIGNYTNFAAPYTNSLILNKKVFVPIDADTEDKYNEAALQVYRDAMPGYTIIGVEYNYDNESGDWDGWYNTDALHCRTHEVMDFNMLFVDHRNVLFGEQAYKESYPITAKFIAYSGVNITETKLHYSINGGEYTTVNMTATGNANEYAANITGHTSGANIKYYVTGKDASGRTCVQPQFGELEPHTFTAGAASGEEPEAITIEANPSNALVGDDIYFTVMQGGNNVTDEALFYIGKLKISNPYTPMYASTFTVRAEKDGLTAETTFTVAEPIEITASPTVITANGTDTVTFTVTQGIDDVTAVSKFFIGTTEISNPYTTTAAGTFTVRAEKDGLTDEITIIANAVQQGGDDNTGGDTSGDVVTIDGTVGSYIQTTSMNVPIYNNYEYAVTQQYYLQSEIGKDGGSISKIAFKTANKDAYYPYTRNIDIYMVNTDDSYFKTKAFNVVSSSDLVFSGEVEFTKNEWINITLPSPFTYNGENILLCINDKTNDYHGNNDGGAGYFDVYKTRVSSNDNYRALYQSSTSSAFNPQNNIVTDNSTKYSENVSLIQFTFGDAGSTTPVAPDAPTNLKAEATEATVTLTWDAVDGASYNVYQGGDLLANVTELTYTVKNLTANTSYTFSVKAVKDQLESDAATVTVKTLEPAPVAPATPTNVVATANGQNSITVTWDAVDGATDYYVYKGGQMWANTNGAITYTENGLAAGTECCFAVQAVNGTLESALSDQACATTEAEQQGGDDNTGGDTSGNVVTIDGTGEYTANASNYVPFNTKSTYTTSQHIYLAKELGNMKNECKITHVAFNVKNAPQTLERTIKIYMVNTESVRFNPSNRFVLMKNTDLVYTGKIKIDANGGGWYNLELDDEFTYTGNNILLCVYDYTGTNSGYNITFHTYNSKVLDENNEYIFRGVYKYGANYDPTLQTSCEVNMTAGGANMPQVKFTFEGGSDDGGDEPTTPIAPAAPANLTASATETTVVLSWDAVDGASYNVYQGEDLLANVTEATYTVNNLTANTGYTFSVKAVKDQLESDAATVTVTTLAPTPIAPAAPANLTASATETTVTLIWDAVDGATSYNVYSNGNVIETVTEATYTVNNLTANTSYTFSVKAVKDQLESDAATVTVTTLAPTPVAPDAPANLTASATETTVALSWDAVDGASYNVYQGEDLLVNVTETTYTVENLTANTSYTFYVKAVKDQLESDAATVTVTTLAEQGGDDNTGGDVVIGDVTSTKTSGWVPIRTYERYSISQQYYLKEDIKKNEGGTITSIAFHTADGDWGNGRERQITIYMQNTTESYFVDNVMKEITAENTVFEGSVTFTSNTWINFDLNDKFTYEGENILVCVYDHTGSYTENETFFKSFEITDSNKARSNCKAGKDVTSSPIDKIWQGGNKDQVAIIKFTFEKEQEVITLERNTTLIKADNTDKVTFTVTKEGSNKEVVTEESEIHISREGDQNETILNSTTGYGFTTTVAGNYTAYAMKGEAISNTVNFRAVYPIKITASTDTIVADNVDYVEFTVKQSAGQGLDSIDITHVATIYVDNSPLSAGVNTFKTNIIDTYYVYAEYDGITSNAVTVVAKSHINYDEDVEGSLDGEYFNPRGYVTYNKGEENEYTLVAIKEEDGTATITEENVWYLGTGPGSMIELIRPNPHKPQADATLIIPEKILFDDNWVTVTEIEDYAFDNLFRFDSWNDYTPGDPLNEHFTNLIIPSTIDTVGTYSFAFNVDTYVICYAKTPPVVGKYPPFLQDTYLNAILYVPAPYVDDYKAAAGWGTGTSGDKNAGFVTILPIETPTFYIKGRWDDESNWVPEYGYPDPGEDVIILEDARIENGTVADVGRVDIISGSITIADGGQLIHTNPGVTVTLEKEIKGYKGVTSPTSWYTISSPLYPSIEASSVENLLSNDFDLYRYDEPTHYWDNIEDLEDTIAEGPHGDWTMLDEGRGYLYANNNDVTLRFNGVANHTGGIYTLTTDVWDGVLKGFHLVGNPFTHDIYMDNAFSTEAPLASGYYILSNTGAWSANLGSDTPIEPCQGVLIKAIEEGTLTINKKVGPATEAQTRSKSNNEFITISVSNKNYEDKAYVSFNAEYPLEKVNHQNKDIPMVYIPMEEDNYAIATMDNDVKEIPVAFEAKTMGQYTIGATAENCEFKNMYLVDRLTGIETNLLLESYTFMATTTDYSKRFIIKLSNNDLDTENFIFINNNEMIINNIEGKGVLQIFDVMGRYISHTEVSGSANISTEAFTSGVYIIRMMDDNGVKTQKVVL